MIQQYIVSYTYNQIDIKLPSAWASGKGMTGTFMWTIQPGGGGQGTRSPGWDPAHQDGTRLE